MGYSFFELLKDSINPYMPLLPFYTSENTKKTGFWIFSGGIKRYHWHEMVLKT